MVRDDLENGANAAIDRATFGSTVIGEGTKIDNLVHIAHNVVLGKHCMIMGQVGFAGSTNIGDYTVIASQSGIADHLSWEPGSYWGEIGGDAGFAGWFKSIGNPRVARSAGEAANYCVAAIAGFDQEIAGAREPDCRTERFR